MDVRALAPVAGICVLVVVVILLASALVTGLTGMGLDGTPPQATIEVTAIADEAGGKVILRHAGGAALALDSVTLVIEVDDQPLRHQPTVPHIQPTGFRDPLTGPFNIRSSDQWRAGEAGEFRLARTNEPTIDAGATVTVFVYVDDQQIDTATAVARASG